MGRKCNCGLGMVESGRWISLVSCEGCFGFIAWIRSPCSLLVGLCRPAVFIAFSEWYCFFVAARLSSRSLASLMENLAWVSSFLYRHRELRMSLHLKPKKMTPTYSEIVAAI